MKPLKKPFQAAPKAFRKVSKQTWNGIADRHYHKLHWKETSITDDIIYHLVKENVQGVQIYQAIHEEVYGHDIDLYIKSYNDKYMMLSLQAKVVYNQVNLAQYNSIEHRVYHPDDKRKPENEKRIINQWDLLDNFQTDRIPFYLFYNGFKKEKFDTLQNIYIRGNFGVTARIVKPKAVLGCSVMLFHDFKSRFLELNEQGFLALKGGKDKISYFTLHQSVYKNAIPWDELFNIKKYNWIEIMEQLGGYKVKTHTGEVKIDGSKYRKLKMEDFGEGEDDSKLGDPNTLPESNTGARYCIVVNQSRNERMDSSPLFRFE